LKDKEKKTSFLRWIFGSRGYRKPVVSQVQLWRKFKLRSRKSRFIVTSLNSSLGRPFRAISFVWFKHCSFRVVRAVFFAATTFGGLSVRLVDVKGSDKNVSRRWAVPAHINRRGCCSMGRQPSRVLVRLAREQQFRTGEGGGLFFFLFDLIVFTVHHAIRSHPKRCVFFGDPKSCGYVGRHGLRSVNRTRPLANCIHPHPCRTSSHGAQTNWFERDCQTRYPSKSP